MKKSILFIVMLGIGVSISAQTFAFGIKGGYEAALSYNELLNTNLITSTTNQVKSGFANGYELGVWMQLGCKKIYLQPELLVNVKKTSQTFNVSGVTIDATYKTQTIEIPLLVGYRFFRVGPLALRLNAGPKAILNAGSSSSLSDYSNVVQSHNYKTMAWALDGGFGIDLLALSLDLRYTRYLTDVATINLQSNQSFGLKSNKESIFLTLGWRIF